MFQALLQTIPELKHDFELRRVIFGLTAIICTEPAHLPAIVSQRLPDIMKSLAMLSIKARDQRLVILKDNEEEIEEQKKKEANLNNDDEDEEVGDDDDTTGADDEDDDAAGNLLTKAKKKNDDAGIDGDEDDDDDDIEDSDYEYTGGDLAIYDSALDTVDELLFIKDALETVNAANPQYMATLMGAMSVEELGKFNENMSNAQALKDREEVVRKQCDDIFDKKKEVLWA